MNFHDSFSVSEKVSDWVTQKRLNKKIPAFNFSTKLTYNTLKTIKTMFWTQIKHFNEFKFTTKLQNFYIRFPRNIEKN